MNSVAIPPNDNDLRGIYEYLGWHISRAGLHPDCWHYLETLYKAARDPVLASCSNCSGECGWFGLASECHTFKHDKNFLMCPECHDSVEVRHMGGVVGKCPWDGIRYMRCDKCKHEWDALCHVESHHLECPKCGHMTKV